MLLFISTIHKQPHLQISSSSSILSLLHWYSWKYKQPHQKTNYKWYEFLLISLKLYIYVCILQWDFSNEFRFDWIWSVPSCANWSTFIKIWYGSFVFVVVVVSCWAGGMQIDNQEGEGKWLAHNAAEKPILWSMYGPSGTEEEWEERVLYGLQYWIL